MFYFPKISKKDVLAFIGFFLLVLFFFFRFLNGKEILAFKDLSRYFYPLRYLMVEQVKQGILPLWNPYIYCGFPLLASLQICFFYPLTLIYYFLPFHLAFNYYIVLHYFLAACFMYLLLRHYQISRIASFLGGVTFAFSGYLLSVSNMNTSLSSAIWLPLVLLFFNRTLLITNYRSPITDYRLLIINLILTAIFLALMFLGGEPTIIYVTFGFLFFYALVFSEHRLKSVALLILAIIIAFGLTAIQLIPFLELARHSDRLVLTKFEIVSMRSFPPREILTFIFPYFFGNPAQLGGYTETLLGKNIQDWLITPYLGIYPLVFVFLSLLDGDKRKENLFFASVALLALFLSFGKYTLVYRIAYYVLPGISLIRYPVKFLFLTTFCLVILSAFGFDRLLSALEKNKESLKKYNKFLFVFGLLLFAIYLIARFYIVQIFSFLASRYPKLPQVFFDRLAEMIRFNLQSLSNLVVFLLLFALLLYLARQKKIKNWAFSLMIFLLVVGDLFSNGISVTISAKKEVFDKIPESYRFLLKDREPYRFFYTDELEKENQMIYGESFSAALYNAKENFCANWPILYHYYDFSGYESIRPLPLADFIRVKFWDENLRKNFDLLSHYNVKYIASVKKLDFPELKLLFHKYKYGVDLYLYENKRVLPRAYLLDGKKKPNFSLGKVRILNYQPHQVLLLVNALKPCLLFLSDSYYPGWKVYVNGQERNIIKVDNLFRGVSIPAGESEVKFVYAPLSFKVGAVISIVSLLLVISCLVVRGWGG